MKKKGIPEKMYDLLKDGKPHTREELHALCGPSCRGVINMHIWKIRKEFLQPGEVIAPVIVKRTIHYQMFLQYRPDLVLVCENPDE